MEGLWTKIQEWVAFYGFKVLAALVIFIRGMSMSTCIEKDNRLHLKPWSCQVINSENGHSRKYERRKT